MLQSKYDKQKSTVATTKRASATFLNLKSIVEANKEAYDVAVQNTTELQQNVDKISNEINQKTNKKLGTVNKNIKDAEQSIKKLENEITKMEVEIRTSERYVKD